MAKIRSVVVEGNREHGYRTVQVLFGTNFFLEITESDGRVSFLLGAIMKPSRRMLRKQRES